MKQRVFIVFILVSLLLIACDSNTEVVDAETQQKQEEITGIEKGIPSTVRAVLSTHYDANWDEDGKGYNLKGSGKVFNRIVYKTLNGKGLLYDGTTSGDIAAESKAARREIYLFLDYDDSLIKSLAIALNNVIQSPFAIGVLELLFKKIRRCANVYYIDVYDVLQNNLNKLKTLSLEDIVLLRTRLLEFEAAKIKLKNDIAPDGKVITENDALAKVESIHAGCDHIIVLSYDIRYILNRID
ncbi:Putative membrane spanning protein (plasmid) [Borrelia crocidurae DOU]|uniref:Putative membrane spanning protein n=1 Tax=Borrelia crocidurae DOU TaxID=1293575 RepID=W5SQW1_9SPIR|nr:virulence associated lipoprotein [Borrelia crocidurae]AHH07446.1 Putative membrane spanning protein [Borrelia crocidurae DOU]